MTHAGLPRRSILRISPRLLAGGGGILALALFALTLWNTHKGREYMIRNLTGRASALIWAVEAGSRTHMALRAGDPHLQLLLQESVKQPDISYMAVTDGRGNVMAYSRQSEAAGDFSGFEDAAELGASDSPQWRMTEKADGSRIFEVYKLFSPLPGFGRHMRRGHGMHGANFFRDDPPCGRDAPPGGAAFRGEADFSPGNVRVIFAGLDARPFEEALAADSRAAALSAFLAGLAAFGGFVSLFRAHDYRVSLRLLSDARAFASEMVGTLPLGLFTCDTGERIALANAEAAKLLGLERDAVRGLPLRELQGMDWGKIPGELERGEPVLERETELRFRDGSVRPISLSASRILNENGFFLGCLFVMRDLEEIRGLRQRLRRSERLSALGNLAAGVAHEIRNPLSSIKGFATVLMGKTAKNGPDANVAAMLIQEVDRLNRVVSSLLEFARPDAVTLAPVALAPIVERALRLCSWDAAAKSVDVRFDPDPELPPVAADEDKLTQALLNLFINAVQAMDKGGRLSVSTTAADSGALLRVADTGKGIAPDLLPSVFDPYVTAKPAGTGLGLALVHRIVEQHGGEISVESRLGEGSVFTLFLPFAGRDHAGKA
jgi:two-component system sensor histidine kinase HydH